jgi:hypothetical protein
MVPMKLNLNCGSKHESLNGNKKFMLCGVVPVKTSYDRSILVRYEKIFAMR